jgi:uracil-DNA glycosylase family 4
MLTKPATCAGCPLEHVGAGFMAPQFGSNGVVLLGEALGADEADAGKPFVGKAGFKLTRLVEWAGFSRGDFTILNSVWCRPPDNKLDGQPFESAAIQHCRTVHWGQLLRGHRVIVPLGNVPTRAITGRLGGGILSSRGYVSSVSVPDGTLSPQSYYVIPTVHPSFIQRGQSKWSAPFIHDIQKAVTLARDGMPPQVTAYVLDPRPMVALQWAEEYRRRLLADPTIRLAFDIETPGKGEDEEDNDTDSDAPDRTWHVERIGFSYEGLKGLSVPWAPEYMAAIRLLMESEGEKVVWNAGFDVPRIRRAGVAVCGLVHDGMVAWHILHSDLPKRLGFVATFTCPWQPAWKHLSGAKPAFYNATDADVEWRSFQVIESELRKADLWDAYQRDVVDLEPILVHMQTAGMPVDQDVRLDRAIKLADETVRVKAILEGAVPLEARRIAHVYVNEPSEKTGLLSRPGEREVSVCPTCGAVKPRKDHFKRYVKKVNPCAGGTAIRTTQQCEEWYRLSEFTPSRDQLVRYHRFLNRPLPMVWDKKNGGRKVSFGEEQIRDLILKYPDDILYPSILEYRGLDKLAGTYIGRPCED